MNSLKNSNKRIIGMWGYPDPLVLHEVISKHPEHEIVDLDIDYKAPSSGILPDAYCRIMRNIIDNALFFKDRIDTIVTSIGEEKCDSGRFASILLKDMGFNIVDTRYENYPESKISLPISTSNLPLETKINTIMSGVISNKIPKVEPSKATFGFWGVPPNDMRFLSLFPDSTHVYGWVRAVEAKRPADIDIEMHVDDSVPTVFFAQTFCSKMQLAKYLAKKHNGLYIDIDDVATNSVKAKVEAFIKLR